MKVLNLYCGIGGNRKLWEGVEVTAVEKVESIAKIYNDLYPADRLVIGDAHQYLLQHFSEFDFIWSSPPCPTHSRMNLINISRGFHKPRYVDMTLYQEILFLKSFFTGKYCVENVITYYEALIRPQLCANHYFWSNFTIKNIRARRTKIANFKGKDVPAKQILKGHGIEVNEWHGYKGNKDQVINNCVEPEVGLHVMNSAKGSFPPIQEGLFSEINESKKYA